MRLILNVIWLPFALWPFGREIVRRDGRPGGRGGRGAELASVFEGDVDD
jgi:uncharacterized membrane protein YccF (DUF307 family)